MNICMHLQMAKMHLQFSNATMQKKQQMHLKNADLTFTKLMKHIIKLLSDKQNLKGGYGRLVAYLPFDLQIIKSMEAVS